MSKFKILDIIFLTKIDVKKGQSSCSLCSMNLEEKGYLSFWMTN